MVAEQERLPTRANYDTHMIETARVVPVSELAEAVDRAGIRCVQVPEPAATIRGVVMHAAGDPAPSRDLLVLCATPADDLPDCVAVGGRGPGAGPPQPGRGDARRGRSGAEP